MLQQKAAGGQPGTVQMVDRRVRLVDLELHKDLEPLPVRRLDYGRPRIEAVCLEPLEVLGEAPPAQGVEKGHVLAASGGARSETVFPFQAGLNRGDGLPCLGVVAQELVARVDAEYQRVNAGPHEGKDQIVEDAVSGLLDPEVGRRPGGDIAGSKPVGPAVGDEELIGGVGTVHEPAPSPDL